MLELRQDGYVLLPPNPDDHQPGQASLQRCPCLAYLSYPRIDALQRCCTLYNAVQVLRLATPAPSVIRRRLDWEVTDLFLLRSKVKVASVLGDNGNYNLSWSRSNQDVRRTRTHLSSEVRTSNDCELFWTSSAAGVFVEDYISCSAQQSARTLESR